MNPLLALAPTEYPDAVMWQRYNDRSHILNRLSQPADQGTKHVNNSAA